MCIRDRRGTTVSYDEVAAVLDRQSCWPYAENARRALPLVDPRRESWLESYSFVTLHQMGLPMPEPQVSLFDSQRRFVARVDGWLEDEVVALESDGKAKYFLDQQPLSGCRPGRPRAAGPSPAEDGSGEGTARSDRRPRGGAGPLGHQ